MHDRESYIAAYDRSAAAIAEYLEKYPSIRYVFDVHRDSLIRGDRAKLRPVTLYDREPCAQLMMLIGSDEKGAGSYDWMGNLTLAEAIQQHLCADTLGVARRSACAARPTTSSSPRADCFWRSAPAAIPSPRRKMPPAPSQRHLSRFCTAINEKAAAQTSLCRGFF